MELVNDLVATIALYATTPVTFNLLTLSSGVATWVYREHTWKSKAIYESRGIIADDALVAKAGWYAYYLIRNRTFYGRLDRGGREIVTYIQSIGGDLLEQYPDNRIHITTYYEGSEYQVNTTIPFHRKIVDNNDVSVLTEDGTLYARRSNTFVLVEFPHHIIGTTTWPYVLLRDGTIVDLLDPKSQKISPSGVVIVDVFANLNILHMITSTGLEFDYDMTSGIAEFDDFEPPTLAYNITSELKRVVGKNPEGIKVVKSVRIGAKKGHPLHSWIIDTTRSFIGIREGKTDSVAIKYHNNVQTALALRNNSEVAILDA